MSTDGISRLIAVTQLKIGSNDEAMRGAERQRGLIEQQKSLHGAQRNLEELPRRGRHGALLAFDEFPRVDQHSALMELRTRLQIFRQSLSPAAAALLDQWVEWASEHR